MCKNHPPPQKLVAGFLLISLALFLIHFPVQAQAGKEVSISAPELGQYPEITVFFSIINRDGSNQTDLTVDEVRLSEDEIEQELLDFQVLNPGIQLVTAINLSSPFSIQDINGISRLDFIKESLIAWSDQPVGSGPDKLSILTNDGLEYAHLTDKAEYRSILEAYTPDIREIESNFNVLARAVSLASDPVEQPGMKRVVLLITSQPTSDEIPAIDSLASQALDNQVIVYTILVSSPAFFNTAGSLRLEQLSDQTGGIFIPFSGEDPLPDLAQLIKPLRSTYQVEYRSQIVTPGNHTLEISAASTLGENIGRREFFLDVQPPNPIFISPPRTITRELPEDNPDPITAVYQPETIDLEVLLDFPDNHPRELEELIFRVNGEVVERKTEPPYDRFTWDLSGYESSATYLISLEAVDIMGLSRSSVQTPVVISVNVPPPNLGFLIRDNALALTGLALILLVGLILFWLVSRGMIQPKEKNLLQTLSSFWIQISRQEKQVKRISSSTSEKTEEQQATNLQPYRLIAVGEISSQLFPEPIKIQQESIILGNQSKTGDVQIYHPSVIKEHAKIDRDQKGQYQITDLGSTAGTWINYKQITGTKPQILKDGDIIHIGEAVFRFQVLEAVNTGPVREENQA